VRRADHSSRGVLPSLMCLSVIVKLLNQVETSQEKTILYSYLIRQYNLAYGIPCGQGGTATTFLLRVASVIIIPQIACAYSFVFLMRYKILAACAVLK